MLARTSVTNRKADPELVAYLKNGARHSESQEDLEAAALASGWDKESVGAAQLHIRKHTRYTAFGHSRPTGRDLAFAVLLSLPVLLVQPLASGSFVKNLLAGGILLLIRRILIVLAGSLLATVLYKIVVHPVLTPAIHPRRGALLWLLVGPLVAIVLFAGFHFSLVVSLICALGLDLLIVILIDWSLVWDLLVASLGMALLYAFLYVSLGQYLNQYGSAFGSGSFSGITWFGLPIEELVLVSLYGALWGPIYCSTRVPQEATKHFLHHHLWPKRIAVGVGVIILGGATYGLQVSFAQVPKAVQTSITSSGKSVGLLSPVAIRFDRPIDRAAIKVSLTPDVSGDLSFDDSYIERSFVRRLTFTPRGHYQPDTDYVVTVSNIGNILGNKNGTYTYKFHTVALPSVTSSSISANQTNVPICDPITVTLDQPSVKLADFSFQLTPVVNLESTVQGTVYTLKPASCLAQSTPYVLTVQRRLTVYDAAGTLKDTGDPVTVSTIAFTTKGAPGIASFQPQGGLVLVSTRQMTVKFSEAMATKDPSAYLGILPAVTGSWAWSDPQTLVFTAGQDLNLNTIYGITLRKGLPDQKQGFLPADAAYTFSTPGPVRASISPRNGSGGVRPGTAVAVSFDQPVDHASAESAFQINPAINGTFSWSGQIMSFAAGLQQDTTYSVTEAAGVTSQIGLPMASNASSSFAMQESTTLLNIPVYYQQHNLSCEVASLKMVLAYRGVSVSEDTLLSNLGDDPSPRNGNVWSDPNQIFVGDVNGHQNTTGYGVYSGPLAQVANQYRSALAVSGWSTNQLSSALKAGNPVVIWGTAGNAKPDNWNTASGASISAWVGEHVRLAVGFTGPVSNPSSFIINDPIFGRLKWTSSQLRANWAAFGNAAVEVF